MSERHFDETCSECGYKGTLEEQRDYDGESLSVSVCPVCYGYDWMLPAGLDEEDIDTLEETNQWAKLESIKILKKHNLYYDIHFSEPFSEMVSEELGNRLKVKVIEICNILETNRADFGKKRNGIIVTFPALFSTIEKSIDSDTKRKDAVELVRESRNAETDKDIEIVFGSQDETKKRTE